MPRLMPAAVAVGAMFAIGAIGLVGCSSEPSPSLLQGAGATRTEVRSVSDFTKVEVRHGIRLELIFGSPAKVELSAQENLLPIGTTAVADGTLTVDASRDYSTSAGMTVKVTTPALSELVLVGTADSSATGVSVGSLRIRTDSGAILNLSGTADSLDLSAKGGGRLDLGQFTAKTATVDLAGGVKVTLGVSGSVKGTAVGGVVLALRGHPTSVDISTTGGATVTQE